MLIKTIPQTTVACMRIRLESYDCLFDRMPEMGALMERAGCECALPEYCFTSYPEHHGEGFNAMQAEFIQRTEGIIPRQNLPLNGRAAHVHAHLAQIEQRKAQRAPRKVDGHRAAAIVDEVGRAQVRVYKADPILGGQCIHAVQDHSSAAFDGIELGVRHAMCVVVQTETGQHFAEIGLAMVRAALTDSQTCLFCEIM